ncbi:hypothetical protein QOT17_003249 [Balamuthia mandrillaris]
METQSSNDDRRDAHNKNALSRSPSSPAPVFKQLLRSMDSLQAALLRSSPLAPPLLDMLKGFLKGFFLYYLPVSLLRRRFTPEARRRAAAIGTFAATARFIHHFLLWLRRSLSSASSSSSSSSSSLRLLLGSGERGRRRKEQLLEWLQRYRHAVQGGTAMATTLWVDPSLGSSTVVLWCLIRAVSSLLPPALSNHPAAPVIVMMLSAGQILSTWIFQPKELDPTYRRFLDYQGDKKRKFIKNALASPSVFVNGGRSVFHPNESVLGHARRFWMSNFPKAFSLYLPLHSAFFLWSVLGKLFNPRSRGNSSGSSSDSSSSSPASTSTLPISRASPWWRRAQSVLREAVPVYISNLMRSSAFLATYCTVAWASCYPYYTFLWWLNRHITTPSYRFVLRPTRGPTMFYCMIAGLAVLIEKPRRRSMLAAYCLTYALDSLYRGLLRHTTVRPSPLVAFVLMTFSAAVMVQHHRNQPAFLIKWLLGISTVTEASTVPSSSSSSLSSSLPSPSSPSSLAGDTGKREEAAMGEGQTEEEEKGQE